MALSLVNNVSSLTAQNNISKTSGMLSNSLERLSSGLKINRGADGPAALVISEQQRAQIAGLKTALDNTNKAVAMVQTGEGALNEINRLLVKVRGLALDSANNAVNDANALAANQAEITNALQSIDRIANSTQFGTRQLLDGSSGMKGIASDEDVTVLKTDSTAVAGTYAVNVTTVGEKANITAGSAQNTALAADETLTLNNVSIKLTAGMTQAQVISTINGYSNQTGVIADNGGTGGATRLISRNFGTAAKISVQSNVAAGNDSSGFGTTRIEDQGVDIAGTIGGVTATGLGNTLTGTGSAKGITISLAASGAINTVTGAQGNVTVLDNSLVFQLGANFGQSAKVALDKSDTSALGLGVSTATGYANLAAIDVRNGAQAAQDALKIIDQAIADISTQRGRLGAFQANTLQSNANNLQTTLQNTTAAESVVRDTDYAEEIANFTKYQVMMQAGQTVLGNANQMTQLVAALLRG